MGGFWDRSGSEGLDSIFGLWDFGGVWGFRGLGRRVGNFFVCVGFSRLGLGGCKGVVSRV